MLTRRDLMQVAMCAPLLAGSARATPADDMTAFIAAMPKAELHVHLEGTLEAAMKFTLARRNDIKLPYADGAAMKRSYVYHDLPSFLAIYYEGNSVLLREADFRDLAYAYLAKAASENVIYAEMFFDPQQHIRRGIKLDMVIAGIARAQAAAQAKLGIKSQLILCFMRDLGPASAMATLEAALPLKRFLVGVGLDSDEHGHPPADFAAVFARARAAGLKVTAHCDVNQENSVGHLREAISDIGVDRIDHGGNILESPALIALARARSLAFTVCPSFSGEVRGGGTPVDVVRGMLYAGLKVTINSDDPAYMGSEYLTGVLVRAQARSRLTKAELLRLERNAFDAAWVDPAQRARFIARLDRFAGTVA